jgi:DNA-binding response OmpR family regulator
MTCIAIHEPDDLMQSLLAEWLREAGYNVHSLPATPFEGYRPVDLVILSLQSPKRDGSGLIRAVRALHPDTPLIALSAQFHSGLPSTGSTARTLGVARVLPKPTSRDELLTAVESVVAGTR